MPLLPDPSTYRAFFANSFDAAFVFDDAMLIEDANAAAEALSGYRHDELLGQPLEMLLPPDIAAAHGGYVGDYLKRRGASVVLGRSRRFTIRTKDHADVPVELKAFELGAPGRPAEFGAVMVDLRERLQLETERDATLDRMAMLALTDELTGLPNRRAFLEALRREHAHARRHGHPASLAIVDIDHFKQVNDTHGHDVGDAVLRHVAGLMSQNLRDDDFVGRLGGEEFGIILSYDLLPGALQAAERLRSVVKASAFHTDAKAAVHTSVSIGVAVLRDAVSAEAALKAADGAMYRAKMLGRNRVETDAIGREMA